MPGGEVIPNQEAIAAALYAVAEANGDLEGLFYFADGEWIGGLQSRWMLLAALKAAYPAIALSRMAAWLGISESPRTLRAELGLRAGRSWWNGGLVARALEIVAP